MCVHHILLAVVVNSDSPTKEYRLSILTGWQEFLHINLYIFDTPQLTMWRVATLHTKQYEEYRLSAINDSNRVNQR
jgi:hypothetical protein